MEDVDSHDHPHPEGKQHIKDDGAGKFDNNAYKCMFKWTIYFDS